jgi:hypothetical protein
VDAPFTVIDADLGGPPEPPSGGSRPLHRRGPVVLVLLVVLVAIVGLVNQHRSTAPPAQLSAPIPHPKTIHPAPVPSPIYLPGRPVDLAGAGPMLFALTMAPARLLRIDSVAPHRVLRATPVSADADQLVLDPDTNQLWVIRLSPYTGLSVVEEYDPLSLSRLSSRTLTIGVTSAISYAGRLWLGNIDGLFALATGAKHASRVGAVTGEVRSITSDPINDRITVTSADGVGSTLISLDATTGKALARAEVLMRRVSLALVGNNLWVAGARPEGTGAVERREPLTLQYVSNEPSTVIRDGTVAVWPGQAVTWVLDGGTLSCLSGQTGKTLTVSARLSGPIVPGVGYAYAIGSKSVQALLLVGTRCPG